MNYVDFFGHKVSKLIVGDNPFTGHSYIPDFVSGDEMFKYHTEDKILEAMHKMEELGINTMLPLASPQIIEILKHYRSNGGKMNFIFQTYAPCMVSYDEADASMKQMEEVGHIGVYISGTYTDVRFETGRKDEITGMLKHFKNHYKDSGIKVGIGTHLPELVNLSETEEWNPDFYMACMYNLRRGREGQESGFLTGKAKTDICIRPTDRAEMLKVLKDVKKPIIAFKIFAGGQMVTAVSEEEKRARIKDAYNTIFTSLKPDDFAVMGIFQKYSDQLGENVEIYNEWYNEQNK